MKICIKGFSDDISSYQKLSSHISPPPATPLYATIAYNAKENSFYFLVKDAQSQFSFPLRGKIEGEIKSFGVRIDPTNFFYIFSQYNDETIRTLEMSFEYIDDNPIVISVNSETDSIQIPCQNVDEDDVEDIISLVEDSFSGDISEKFTFTNNDVDILRGINEGLSFMGTDENVNNALSIFQDRVSYNDRRHIYLYGVQAVGLSDEIPLHLHKKPSKIIDSLYLKGAPFKAELSVSGQFVWIKYQNSVMKINNSLCNTAPPSRNMLNKMFPKNKVAEISLSSFLDTASFFTGFYVKGDAWKPLAVTIQESDIVFELRSSTKTSTSCSVQRNFPFTPAPDCDLERIKNTMVIINDSLLTFLKLHKGKTDTTVTLYAEDGASGVVFSYDNRQILIAILNN